MLDVRVWPCGVLAVLSLQLQGCKARLRCTASAAHLQTRHSTLALWPGEEPLPEDPPEGMFKPVAEPNQLDNMLLVRRGRGYTQEAVGRGGGHCELAAFQVVICAGFLGSSTRALHTSHHPTPRHTTPSVTVLPTIPCSSSPRPLLPCPAVQPDGLLLPAHQLGDAAGAQQADAHGGPAEGALRGGCSRAVDASSTLM